jgi:uncharacterized membrane protein YccC
MFPWSKKVVKSVTFNQEVADETLLAVVESVLQKQPNKTFSDLCKEALWQALCVPESVRPGLKAAEMEHKIAEVQQQLADFEQRFFAKEANRLEAIESQLSQLTQQVAQLALLVNTRPNIESFQQLESPREAVTSRELQSPREAVTSRELQSPREAITSRELQSPRETVTPRELESSAEAVAVTPPQDVDPLLSRLSQFLDDF